MSDEVLDESGGFDPCGPGTPAWEHAEAAVNHGVMGRPVESQEAIDAMTRELVAHGRSSIEIREWEREIAEMIANPEPGFYDHST